MSEKKFNDWMDAAQAPNYDTPWSGPVASAPAQKASVVGVFRCRVFMIHRPPGACPICRGPEDDEGDDQGGGRPAEPQPPAEYAPCPHTENAEYVALVNRVHAEGGRIVTREPSTLKNGAIQVHMEWVDAPPKKK